jgi:RNA polymerase sigma factor (sigma-70 family)
LAASHDQRVFLDMSAGADDHESPPGVIGGVLPRFRGNPGPLPLPRRTARRRRVSVISDWEAVPGEQTEEDLAELFSLVGSQVRSYVRGLTRRLDCEDIVSETILRLKGYLDGRPGDRPDSVVAAALRIARNLVIDEARHNRRQVPLPAEELDAAVCFRVEDFADRRAEIIDAFAALRALPGDLREMVTLVCLTERTVAEAAHLLGISVRTAQRRFRKGRERLWRALESGDR